MPQERVVLDSDRRYIDSQGNLLRSRTEHSVAKMLSFLGLSYKYNQEVLLKDGSRLRLDFRVGDRFIEVVEGDEDVRKVERVKADSPELAVVGIGHPKFAATVKEINSFFVLGDPDREHTGSIFIEDPSLAFDYAHILPLVEKCSVLHGHTSTVMVELIGVMKDNLVIDFGEAKRVIKETLNEIDHKFFINRKYLHKEDTLHYYVSFEGPRGYFSLQLPKTTTYMLGGEATVENLSLEIIRLLAPKMPKNIEAIGVYIYEGVNKGAHIIAGVQKG
ncbi:MAG: 6-carboxytetrahydropterin synthase [Nitrososphaera sp.]|jgi:6-pyruvoyltetrahydropterin/6-carboxytetrahydropterin synthase